MGSFSSLLIFRVVVVITTTTTTTTAKKTQELKAKKNLPLSTLSDRE
jgi:hypothetical protein